MLPESVGWRRTLRAGWTTAPWPSGTRRARWRLKSPPAHLGTSLLLESGLWASTYMQKCECSTPGLSTNCLSIARYVLVTYILQLATWYLIYVPQEVDDDLFCEWGVFLQELNHTVGQLRVVHGQRLDLMQGHQNLTEKNNIKFSNHDQDDKLLA